MCGNSLNSSIKCLTELNNVRNQSISLNFSQINVMGKGDLMVLFAQIEKSIISHKNKIYRVGQFSSNKVIKNYLKSNSLIFHDYKEFPNPILEDSEKQKFVNPFVIDTLVNDLKKIGIRDYYFPFNTFLTELIGNAVEHGLKSKKISWWLTHEINRADKIIKYTFVDMGLGIVNSHKQAGLPFKYNFFKTKKIVIDSFFGKLMSSTKQVNRGRGLPQLREMIEREIISDFHLITNRVSLNYFNGKFETSNNPDFLGTYYSWSVNPQNFIKWKNSQLI